MNTKTVFASLELTWVEDLLYYDGPWITHFRDGEQDWVFCWMDVSEDAQTDTWCAIKTTREDLEALKNTQLTMLEIYARSTAIYVNQGQFLVMPSMTEGVLTPFADVEPKPHPDSYLPC